MSTDQFTLTGGTATTVPYLNSSKKLTSSAVTPTELGYLSGVTSAIQTQLGLKAPLANPSFSGTVSGTFAGNITGNVTGALTGNADTATSAAKWTTTRNLAGNSVDGSANVAFANKFIVQGTSDSGLSAAQFLGSLGTGIVKNTTTTGVLSIAIAADFPTLNQNTSGTAADLSAILSLAHGGTHADLSATGGASQVLKQTSVGGNVSVARLACSDLSDSVASCSTDATNAANIASGVLPIARGGTNNGSLAVTAGGVVLTDGSKLTNSGAGTSGQVLKSAGSGAAAFGDDVGSFGISLDGGGSVLTTGVKGDVEIPYTGTITGWTLVGDQTGSIVIDVWKDTYANFPPTVAKTITGADIPTISSSTKGQNLSLSAWITSVTAGDIVRFNVNSVTSITRATLIVRVKKL